MGWKKIILGEKMPDKNDPKYKQRYEDEVNAGRKFARITKIDKVAGKIQHFANVHTKLFLALVFGFVFLSFGYNIYRMASAYGSQQDHKTATEQQEEMLKKRHNRISRTISSAHCMPPGLNKDFQKYNNLNKEDNGTEGSIEED